jgi:hypothetical protein
MEYDFNFQLEIRGPCLLAGEKELLRLAGAQRSPKVERGLQTQRPPGRGKKRLARKPIIPDRRQAKAHRAKWTPISHSPNKLPTDKPLPKPLTPIPVASLGNVHQGMMVLGPLLVVTVTKLLPGSHWVSSNLLKPGYHPKDSWVHPGNEYIKLPK